MAVFQDWLKPQQMTGNRYEQISFFEAFLRQTARLAPKTDKTDNLGFWRTLMAGEMYISFVPSLLNDVSINKGIYSAVTFTSQRPGTKHFHLAAALSYFI